MTNDIEEVVTDFRRTFQGLQILEGDMLVMLNWIDARLHCIKQEGIQEGEKKERNRIKDGVDRLPSTYDEEAHSVFITTKNEILSIVIPNK